MNIPTDRKDWQNKLLVRMTLPHWIYISDDIHKILTYFLGRSVPTKCTIKELSTDLSIPVRSLIRKIDLLKYFEVITTMYSRIENFNNIANASSYTIHEIPLIVLDYLLMYTNFEKINKSIPYKKLLKSKLEVKLLQKNKPDLKKSLENGEIKPLLDLSICISKDFYEMPKLNFLNLTCISKDFYEMPKLENGDHSGVNEPGIFATTCISKDFYEMPKLENVENANFFWGLASRVCAYTRARARNNIYIYHFFRYIIFPKGNIYSSRSRSISREIFPKCPRQIEKNEILKKSKISSSVKSINPQICFFGLKRTKFSKNDESPVKVKNIKFETPVKVKNIKFETPVKVKNIEKVKFCTPKNDENFGSGEIPPNGGPSYARTTHHAPISGAKGEDMINGLGLIKNAPQNGAERKTRSCIAKSSRKAVTPKSNCEKFVDFWNELAQDYPIPKIMKVRGGNPTKGYQMALKFFHALRSGSLLTGNSAFTFSKEYLASTSINQLSKDGYSDSDIFYLIKVVATNYENQKYVPSTFSRLLYTKFGATAEKYGGGVSRFLEIMSEEMEDSRLGRQLELEINEQLTDEEYHILRDILCDLYHRIRKDGSKLEDVPDFELSNLLAGMKCLKKIYIQYQSKLKSSYEIKSRDINPTFFWFVDTYADLVEIPNWHDMPMTLLFDRRKKYLGTFLSKLEAML